MGIVGNLHRPFKSSDGVRETILKWGKTTVWNKRFMSVAKGFALLVVVLMSVEATNRSYYMFYGSRLVPFVIGAVGALGVFAAYRYIDANKIGRIVAVIPAVLLTLIGVKFLIVDPNSFGMTGDWVPNDLQLQLLDTMMERTKAEGLLFLMVGLAVITGAVAGVKARAVAQPPSHPAEASEV